MTQRKPDRFERVVNKLSTDCEAGLWKDDVVKLLRQGHEWVRRMVKADPLFGAKNTEWKQGYTAALEAILDKLSQRRK
jgi:hypothetical protein